MDVDIEDIFNILVGVYCLVVDDVNVCFYDIIFILSELFVLSVVIVVEVEDICEGGQVEQFQVVVSGGVFGYEYYWSNGMDQLQIFDFLLVDYSLIVVDVNGCEWEVLLVKVKVFIVVFELDIFYIVDVSCNGQGDGCVVVWVVGGFFNYQFYFSNGYIEVMDINIVFVCNFSLGNYWVMVIDLFMGCNEKFFFIVL